MKLRKNWDRTSAPIASEKFVGFVVAEEAFARYGRVERLEAQIKALGEFCQTLFDVLPEKTRAKIAAEFGWEQIE